MDKNMSNDQQNRMGPGSSNSSSNSNKSAGQSGQQNQRNQGSMGSGSMDSTESDSRSNVERNGEFEQNSPVRGRQAPGTINTQDQNSDKSWQDKSR